VVFIREIRAYIGHGSGSMGTVSIDGAGSIWTHRWGYLSVGDSGSGLLQITGGGLVRDGRALLGYEPGSTGKATVNGTGSTWRNGGELGVGRRGSGEVSITGGGTLTSNQGNIGDWSGSTGTVMVNGVGSTWTSNDGSLTVGRYGDGTLSITAGGVVNSINAIIGERSSSKGVATVDGAGSAWANSSSLSIGYYGSGALDVTRGAVLSSGNSSNHSYIGNASGSTGVATVDGGGSTWTSDGDLYVGRNGNGTLTITRGGMVNVSKRLIIDYDKDGDGFVNMATGGMLALEGEGDDSITDFLDLMVFGTGAIRYWDDSISDWADITGATPGEDYSLEYFYTGLGTGYTVLTVPEPATLCILACGALGLLRRRRRLKPGSARAGKTGCPVERGTGGGRIADWGLRIGDFGFRTESGWEGTDCGLGISD